MDWILDHLFTLIIIAGVISQLINAIRGKKGEDAAPRAPEERSFEDPDLAERTRKIREEIQRKIAERQRAGRGGPAVQPEHEAPEHHEGPAVQTYEEPRPVEREVVIARPPPMPAPAYGKPGGNRWDTERAAEILEQQHAMFEQVRQLDEMRAAAKRRVAFEQNTDSGRDWAAREKSRAALLVDLRDPVALKRAFVMREVLGPPVALRR